MSGILIDRQVYGRDSDTAYLDRYDRVIKTCDSVFKKEDHVYKIYSQLHTGCNRHSGKRYFRWDNTQIQGIKRHPSTGNIIAYAWVQGKNVGPQSTWVSLVRRYDLLSNNQIEPDPFQRTVKDVLGISHWHDVYPVAKHYNIEQYYSVPSPIIGAMRAETSRLFVERLFGKRAYRRDLLKAVGSTNIYSLHYAKAFKGLVPIDWIINFLRNNNLNDIDPCQWGYSFYRDPRKILTRIDPRSYRHLLTRPIRVNDYYLIEDTVRFIEQNGFQDEEGTRYYRSWQDVHDRNMPRYNYSHVTQFEDCEINLLPIAEALNGLTTKSFEIVPATHTTQLTEWGQAMHNCIGGYRTMAAKGSAILGAVYSNGKLTANFELGTNKKLKQLLGPCNKSLGKNQRAELEAAFKSKGVDVQGYWGSE